MRKILIILSFLLVTIGYSQVVKVDVLNRTEMTTAQMNAITVAQGLVSGSEILNIDTETIWRYNGSIWENTGGGGGATTDASDLTTGVLADARVQQSNVTQHQTSLAITESQITDLGTYLTSETDPVFTASDAFNVTALGITNWDTAFSWGDHGSAGYAMDADVVKLIGTQSISGGKTFTVPQIFNQGINMTGLSDFVSNFSFSNETNEYFNTVIPTTNLFWLNNGYIAWRNSGQAVNAGAKIIQNNTAVRNYTFPDKDGTVAMLDDLGVGSDDQTALEVPFTPAGNTTSTNVQTAIEEVQTELDGVAAGGISTVNQNKIDNTRKFDPNIKSGGSTHTLSAEDFVLTSTGNEGTRAGIAVTDGSTQNVDWTDAVITPNANYPLPIPAYNGTIINTLESSSTYTFSTYGGGTTGDVWTVTNSSGTSFVQGNTIFVSGGTVSTSAPPATYTEGNALNGIINENDLDGITWNASDFTVTSIVDPEDAGKFALRVERIALTGTAYDFDIPLTGLVSGTTYTVSIRANRTAAANYFQVRLRTVTGWTSDETVTPLSAFSDLTFAAQAATATPPSINLRALGGGSPGDVLIIKGLIATPQ